MSEIVHRSIEPGEKNTIAASVEEREIDPVVRVAVGVIADQDGLVLLARRPEQAHQGGRWEFPGGKMEGKEGVEQALRRELAEELGIEVQASRPLLRVRHSYPDKQVLLEVQRVTRYTGTPRGREGQPLVWVPPEQLPDYSFPTANLPIISAVRLPSVYLVTAGPVTGAEEAEVFLDRLRANLEAGVKLVQLRVKGIAPEAYRALAQRAIGLCRHAGARLLLNAAPELAQELGADGVHLDSRRLMALEERPLPADYWVAGSCHDGTELHQAAAMGLDFAVVSPVLPTDSHPGEPHLGWSVMEQLLDEVPLPVYALGGMGTGSLGPAWGHGAQGVAVLSALWKAADPAVVLRRLNPEESR